MPQILSTSPSSDFAESLAPESRSRVRSLLKHAAGRLTGVSQLSRIYDRRMADMQPGHFARFAMRELEVDYTVFGSERDTIPKEGPLVIVANHPYGAIEGLILVDLLTSVRPDVKFMANEMLTQFPELERMMIPVDPFGGKDAARKNVRGLHQSIKWLTLGGALVVFPAGTVGHLQLRLRQVTDPAWSPTIARIIRKTKATVQPIFFPGRNNAAFQAAGLLHPRLRTALLPRQLLNKRGRTLMFHVGKPIVPKRTAQFDDDTDLIRYLRFRTFLMSHRSCRRRVTTSKKHETPIIAARSRSAMEQDIGRLPGDALLVEKREFAVYQATPTQIPNILEEIGRLREVSFRDCGEGTGQATDLDGYDRFYRHLFTWDKQAGEIVGAYRFASVQEILQAFGPRGLYICQLFKIKPGFFDAFGEGLELGRSFVQPAYQRHPLSLFLLWRGVGEYLVRNPHYRNLIGPVSISNDYHSAARRLMAKYIRNQLWDDDLAAHVAPRFPFSDKMNELDADAIVSTLGGIDEVSELLAEIAPASPGVPVLLRHYLKIGGNVVALSRDPDFSDVLDALTVVRMGQGNPRHLARYLGKEGATAYLGWGRYENK